MLYEALVKYDEIILYEELRNKSNEITYVLSISFTDVEKTEGDESYIVLTNDSDDRFKIKSDLKCYISPLPFCRDRIEIYTENEKIVLFGKLF